MKSWIMSMLVVAISVGLIVSSLGLYFSMPMKLGDQDMLDGALPIVTNSDSTEHDD